MRIFNIIALLQLLFINWEDPNPNYIKIEYDWGSVDKPMPRVLFYFNPYKQVSDVPVYGQNFKIKKKDFYLIKQAIEESKASIQIDTAKGGTYNFIIVNRSKKTAFIAKDKGTTRILFDEILSQIPNYNKRQDIEYYFDEIIARGM